MLKNYFKIAVRNIFRNKAYSAINIAGLTLGITCASLLFMYVIDELNFDGMHPLKDRICRIVEADRSGDNIRYYGQTTPPAGPALVEDFNEVASYTRLLKFGGHINFSIGDTKYGERSYYIADTALFSVFNFKFASGDPNTALSQPFSAVIDEDWASALFGREDPINKELIIDGDAYTIKGVIKKLPANSHLQFKILLSYPPMQDRVKEYLNDWSSYGAYTYVLLKEGADVNKLSQKIPDFIARHFKPEDNRDFYFQPLMDIHFNSKSIEFGTDAAKGQRAYVYIFIVIGIFMLLIACINYMNLATAKSLHRGKEIGIRKVSGAARYQLIFQFLGESTLIAFISFALAIGLVDLVLPYFNELTDKQFVLNASTFGSVFGLLFIITSVIGLLSGTYPALMLSRLKPAVIVKGNLGGGKGSGALRKALVVTQFTLSIIMIVATIIVSNQMSYIRNMPLGFNKDQLMVIDINNGQVRQRFEAMKAEFLKSPYIKKVAVSSRVPGEWKNLAQVYVKVPQSGRADSLRSNFIGFDADMLNVYDIQLKEGKNFSGDIKADSLKVLINETAAKVLELNDPVGKYLEMGGGLYQISGVVKNFNFQSLHNEIGPVILGFRENAFQSIDYFSLKFDPDHTQEAVADATKVHNSFDNNTPIEYHFLDQQWELFYKNDRRAGNIFTIGAGITIFIACLGLFGLASFIIQKRTKEIGVRKVLGASIIDLFILLSRTFVLQVLIAFIIAVPISWYVMSDWLDTFAFKFDLGPAEFLTGGAAALAIALVSVSYRVLKAATLNPATTLKDE